MAYCKVPLSTTSDTTPWSWDAGNSPIKEDGGEKNSSLIKQVLASGSREWWAGPVGINGGASIVKPSL